MGAGFALFSSPAKLKDLQISSMDCSSPSISPQVFNGGAIYLKDSMALMENLLVTDCIANHGSGVASWSQSSETLGSLKQMICVRGLYYISFRILKSDNFKIYLADLFIFHYFCRPSSRIAFLNAMWAPNGVAQCSWSKLLKQSSMPAASPILSVATVASWMTVAQRRPCNLAELWSLFVLVSSMLGKGLSDGLGLLNLRGFKSTTSWPLTYQLDYERVFLNVFFTPQDLALLFHMSKVPGLHLRVR